MVDRMPIEVMTSFGVCETVRLEGKSYILGGTTSPDEAVRVDVHLEA